MITIPYFRIHRQLGARGKKALSAFCIASKTAILPFTRHTPEEGATVAFSTLVRG